MATEICFHEALGIIEQSLIGSVSSAELNRDASRMAELARTHDVRRFLINLAGLVQTASAGELYRIVGERAHDGLTSGSKIAFLAPEGTAAERDARFFETLSVNRGWEARVFFDRDSAVEWLSVAET